MTKTSHKKNGSETKQMTPLEFALNFEINGAQTYLKLAVKSVNPLGKKLFYSLAAEEIEHAQRIDEIHSSLNADAAYRADTLPILPSVASRLQSFFRRASEAELRKDEENTEGYLLAMEMERKGYAAYEEFLGRATDERERKFFAALLEEEKEHLDALSNVYSYLTNTDDWLRENESQVWNWMNI